MLARYFLKTLIVLGACFSCVLAWAQTSERLTPITGENLTALFSDTTMFGIYKDVREQSGTNEFTETFNSDGTTDYREGELSAKGYWSAQKDIICFRYDNSMFAPLSCFSVFKSGTCYYSYSLRNVKNGYPVDTNYWSAKTILKGEVSTCDNLVS